MPLSLRRLVVLFLLAAVPAFAADLPDPWVEFTSDGGVDVRAITAPGMSCPNVVADGTTVPTATRGQPDPANGPYPLQVCIAHTTTPPRKVTVEGVPIPTLHDHVRQIVVIGDTGCRLKGDIVQDCNDPVKWPFATVARLAAAHRPDLVIHVGDYHYRETACPADRPGCAGSPYGDNWAVWQRDFFNPAAPLLAAAPWVLVRGNHELCDRGGHGWFRLLDPHPDTVDCTATTAPYTLRIDGLTLLMFDSADADDDKAPPEKVAVFRPQFQSLLAEVPPHAWLLTHRPVWALAQGRGVPQGATSNATEQAAIAGLVPPTLDMILSGHIHDFASYEFGPARPAQLVVGEGGDLNDAITQPLSAGIPIDGMKPRRAFTTPDYGFILLRHSPQAWSATVYSIADQVLAHCSLHGRDVFCRPAPR
jgi:predicted phosphodiesterase